MAYYAQLCFYVFLQGKKRVQPPKIFHVLASVCSKNWNLGELTKFQLHQICRCVMKFCQFDKIPLRTCVSALGSYALVGRVRVVFEDGSCTFWTLVVSTSLSCSESFMFSYDCHYYTPPHVSGGVLCFHVGRPCVRPCVHPSVVFTSVRTSFPSNNLSISFKFCMGLLMSKFR